MRLMHRAGLAAAVVSLAFLAGRAALGLQGARGPEPGSRPAAAFNSGSLYVLEGETLARYDLRGRLVGTTRLPAEPAALGPARLLPGPSNPPGEGVPRPTPGGMPPAADGPWNHRVLRAVSADGRSWKQEGPPVAEPGSVPDAVLDRDGRVRLYFVDGGASIRTSVEAKPGVWEPAETNLTGADPCAIRLPDGRLRCFVKQGVMGARIVFADSDDGVRFGPATVAWADTLYPNASDPDVFPVDGGWVMYLSLGPRLLLAESASGSRFRSVRTLDVGGSVGDTLPVEGGYRMFFHRNPTPREPRMAIWSAFSRDGRAWTPESGPALAPSEAGPDRLGAGDPAVIRLPGGGYQMFYKSYIRSPGG